MANAPPAVPSAERHFEDYVPGMTETLGPIAMTEAAIIEFAKRYDPQAIHVDPRAAAAGPFGGLISSGWHTVCVMMRELVDNYLTASAALASPGIDELRWQKPVRPGDSLHVRAMVVEANRSRSKPDRGLVRTSIEAINQHGEIVMSMTAMNLIRCREVGVDSERGS
ncbi:MAG TPA: MaoC family dehydratase [Casimicrobiaceae bacterium]|nr:MaoC family dehydratase [Casimicrobiaceae bacterium]